jgi:hypothetical protein
LVILLRIRRKHNVGWHFLDPFVSGNFFNFETMEVQVNIGFEQLVHLAKQLPAMEWKKLKTEVEKHTGSVDTTSDLEQFLLTAPTFNKKQLDEIAKTRKAISQWRTK